MQGVIKAVDGNSFDCGDFPDADIIIFQLPAGYRPADRAIFPTIQNSVIGRVNVDSTGVVSVQGPNFGDAEAFLSLDGLNFRAVF